MGGILYNRKRSENRTCKVKMLCHDKKIIIFLYHIDTKNGKVEDIFYAEKINEKRFLLLRAEYNARFMVQISDGFR